VGRGPGPVWLGEDGNEEGRAWGAEKLTALERCYQDARRKDPALVGHLTVTLTVNAVGEVNPGRMDGLKHASLRKCVRGALHGQLPKKPAAAFRTTIVVNMSANDRD